MKLLAFLACASLTVFPAVSAAERAPPPLRVVATTGMIADLVQRVGGPAVAIDTLMGPGVDPHLYQPTPADLVRLQSAAVVFYNGLHLEGKMAQVFAQRHRSGRPALAVAEALPRARLIVHPETPGHPDPHVWFDVALWAGALPAIEAALAAARPAETATFRANAARAAAQLTALDAWVRSTLASVPAERRVLVTSHDAFGYFGRAYDFEVVALQGISTANEAGLADVAKLVDFIRARRLPAVFVESTISPATLRRIARDSGAEIGGELFSDALGTPGTFENGHDAGTFEGMIRHNVSTIVSALR